MYPIAKIYVLRYYVILFMIMKNHGKTNIDHRLTKLYNVLRIKYYIDTKPYTCRSKFHDLEYIHWYHNNLEKVTK